MVKITRLPSGSYRARVHLGGGKYKSITGKDKKDVQLKAAQLEAACTARVECRREEEGLYLPETVWISGSLSQQQREELTGILLEELGLTPEALHYEDGEGTP